MLSPFTGTSFRAHCATRLHGRDPPPAENLLLHLDSAARDRIFAAKANRGGQHGQARVNELFRAVQGRSIRRAELASVEPVVISSRRRILICQAWGC